MSSRDPATPRSRMPAAPAASRAHERRFVHLASGWVTPAPAPATSSWLLARRSSTPWQGHLAGGRGDLTALPGRSEPGSWPDTRLLRPRRAGGLAPTLPGHGQPPSSPWAGRERAAAAAGGADRRTDRQTARAQPPVRRPELWGGGLAIPCPHQDWQSLGWGTPRASSISYWGTNPTRGVPHHPQTEPGGAKCPQPFAYCPPRSQT